MTSVCALTTPIDVRHMRSGVLVLAMFAGSCGAADTGPGHSVTEQAQTTTSAEPCDGGPPTSYSAAELQAQVDTATAFAGEICACKDDDCLRAAVVTYRPTLRRIRQSGDEEIAQRRQFDRAWTCVRLHEIDERERKTSLLVKFLRAL